MLRSVIPAHYTYALQAYNVTEQCHALSQTDAAIRSCLRALFDLTVEEGTLEGACIAATINLGIASGGLDISSLVNGADAAHACGLLAALEHLVQVAPQVRAVAGRTAAEPRVQGGGADAIPNGDGHPPVAVPAVAEGGQVAAASKLGPVVAGTDPPAAPAPPAGGGRVGAGRSCTSRGGRGRRRRARGQACAGPRARARGDSCR